MFRLPVVILIVSAAFAADVRIVEEIAVKVNGDIITQGDLEERRRIIRQGIQQQEHLSGPALDAAVEQQSKDMLCKMIDERLLVQKAKELDIKVDPEVTRRMAELQLESGLSDPDKFHEWLRQQTGMTFEDFKQHTTDAYLTNQLVRSEISSHIVVPEEDARKFYEDHKAEFVKKDQVYLSQLEISTQGKTPEQEAAAEKKAQDLVARARRGDKFSELVIANSDDPETSRTGGQLPPMEKGMLRKEIEEVVFNPKNPKGYVTDPIKTDGGIVILRIEDRTEAGQASFDEAKEQIQEHLAGPKMEPKMREYLNKLRTAAFLEIKDGYVDTGAVPGKDTRWHEVVGLKPETTTKEEVAAHRRRKKFLGVIPHGSVAPGTKETTPSRAAAAELRNSPASQGPAPADMPPPTAPIKQDSTTVTPPPKDAPPPTAPIKQDPTTAKPATAPPNKQDPASGTPPVKQDTSAPTPPVIKQ
ncbi:MAG: peptidylprolyl isomerase [Bryobacteraceae bacterium]|jgi:parvulin-like peptidyl-prolyl isomerase